MSRLIPLVILFLLGNLLDVATTYAGMKGASKEEMEKKELNVLLASHIHNKKFILAWKFGFSTLLIVILLIAALHSNFTYYFNVFKFLTVFIFIIVINNLYAYWANKKGKLSLGNLLIAKLKFPKVLAFLFLIIIYGLLAFEITYLFFWSY